MTLKKVDEIIDKYHGEDCWLVMILQDVQKEYNFLPVSALKRVAENLQIPLSRVYNIATFYSSFSLEERGKHLVILCNGTTCHLRGFDNLRDEIDRQLGIRAGQTTKDKMFTLEVVACLGACALAPVMAIDEKCYGNMTPEKVRTIFESYRKMKKRKKSGK
jgi:NADH-quinone oxidoreductase subunit E